MKMNRFFFIGALVLTGSSLQAEEPSSCPRCQLIREENAKKGPPEFEYYDDYLKAEQEKARKIEQAKKE